MYNSLKNTFNSLSQITEQDWQMLESLLRIKHFDKDDFYLKDGRIERQIGFINKSSFRWYFISSDGEEINFHFFFDHTAYNYLAGISEAWRMRFYGGYSAEMMDLMRPKGQIQLQRFAEGLLAAIAKNAPIPINHEPLVPHDFIYIPAPPAKKIDQGNYKVRVLMDGADQSPNLSRMVERIEAAFVHPVEVVDFRKVHFKGGCQGCLQCGLDNQCDYEGKDEFIDIFRDKVMTADVLFFAGTIRDRYLSATWKTFFDRSFFHGYASSLVGKQVAWVVSGPLRQIPNLRQIM